MQLRIVGLFNQIILLTFTFDTGGKMRFRTKQHKQNTLYVKEQEIHNYFEPKFQLIKFRITNGQYSCYQISKHKWEINMSKNSREVRHHKQ